MKKSVQPLLSATPDSPPAQRFLSCAHRYGAARNRWPEEDRALYDVNAATPWGQQALAAALELDQWLDGAPLPELDTLPSPAWTHQTLDYAFAARAPSSAFALRTRRWMGPAAVSLSMMACSVGGFLWGFNDAVAGGARDRAPGSFVSGVDLTEVDPWLIRFHEAIRTPRSRPARG